MPDLISLPRAVQNSTLAGLAAANPGYLASLITAASDALRRACGRDFSLGSYTEYHSGGIFIREPLRLRQFPVVEISRVAAGPLPALLVQNVDALTNQRATVETTPTGVRLVSVASAVVATTDLLFSTYPTVASLASAINLLGNGWSAIVRNDFANWPSADFKNLQGAVSALLAGHDLEIYRESIQPLATWPWSTGDGDSGYEGAVGWRLDEETGEMFGRFRAGSSISASTTAPVLPPSLSQFRKRACNWRRTCIKPLRSTTP